MSRLAEGLLRVECSGSGGAPRLPQLLVETRRPESARGQDVEDRLNRWRFRPIVATAGTLVAVVEQRPHIAPVERLGQLLAEVGADIGQIETDAVPLGGVVHTKYVVVAAGCDHGGDGAPGDA